MPTNSPTSTEPTDYSGRDPAFAASPSSPIGSRPSGLQSGVAATADDYDNMHHAFGRPVSSNKDCYRNYFCVSTDSDLAMRFEALGWWDFGRTINGERDSIYHVNGAGKQALAEWMATHAYEYGRWVPRALAAGAQSAETNEDLAQSEGRQRGPKGNAQTPGEGSSDQS